MKTNDIELQDAARKFLEGISQPVTDADIIDAFIEGAHFSKRDLKTRLASLPKVKPMGLDAVLANIQHYAFDICITMMTIDNGVSRILKLEEPLTAKQSKALKAQMGMTDTAIKVLRRCKANWQSIQRDLDTLSPWMYGRVKKGAFDFSCAMSSELIAVLALYLVQTDCDKETTNMVLNTLMTAKPLGEDVSQMVYKYLHDAEQMRERAYARRSEADAEGEEV